MCGRYTVAGDPESLRLFYGAEFREAHRPIFNASPGQRLPVILDAEPGAIQPAFWGFAVEFHGRPRRMLINARAETADRLPTFRGAFRHRRCLVVADGFYEWKPTGGDKQPYRIVLKTEEPCTFAGIWREVEGEPTYVILTTEASPQLRPIHHRMPLILGRDEVAVWLDPDRGVEELKRLLRPYPGDAMRAYPVSRAVNNSRNQGRELIDPVARSPE